MTKFSPHFLALPVALGLVVTAPAAPFNLVVGSAAAPQPTSPAIAASIRTRLRPLPALPLPNQLVAPLPGEIIPPRPGETVAPLSGEIVRSLPGQMVRALPGEIVKPLPGEIVAPLPGQIVR